MIFTIVSIWPLELQESRPMFSPVKVFTVPPATPGGFSTLQVTDATQRDYAGADQYMNMLVSAEELARDLVSSYRRFSCGNDGRIGVFMMEGTPTEQQIVADPQYQECKDEQDKLCRNLIIEARYLESKQLTGAIGARHFRAAEYLRVVGESWQNHDLKRDARMECPYCSKYIVSHAIKCPECKEVVNPEAYAAQLAKTNRLVEAAVQQNSISALKPSSKPVEVDGIDPAALGKASAQKPTPVRA